MDFADALGIVRLMIDRGVPQDVAIDNPAIPEQYRQRIREVLAEEENVVLEPARILVAAQQQDEWLRLLDRSTWHYWPALRRFLLGVKRWDAASVRSLDEVTDRILRQIASPSTPQFDTRGLVLGYVQSGKTANFTALIAKAADVGYRLIIVLSGTDNGLRRQTQIRLNRELVGYADDRPTAVRLPPMGVQWHQFTSEDLDGDFRPGHANYGALQGTQPVLLVIKKNGPVLRRLRNWLDDAPEDTRRTLPVFIVDDEADQASVDTRGTYQTEAESLPEDYEEPSTINGLIRELLGRFQRRVYVAYTATPFANILIPHDTFDPRVENDLYPKDFIVDLPKPPGYFGAEELFGRFDRAIGEAVGGLDVIRSIPDTDSTLLSQGVLPLTLEFAILDFVLAGAAKAQRGFTNFPATMLVHISQGILDQFNMAGQVNQRFSELRDEWRYQRHLGIRGRLIRRWEEEFRPVIRARYPERDVAFDQVESCIGPFFESVRMQIINSATGDVLDYERESDLKVIAVGGNRLSRGLTLEGLLTSYFARRTIMYDTLMQMGRWFGFREGYDDLTRIYMPLDLAGWFSDLALVEHELREDIQVYEAQDLTPLQLSARILQHPGLLVTSRVKQRYGIPLTIEQSYSAETLQTLRFPFQRPRDLAELLEANINSVRSLILVLGTPLSWPDQGPVWQNVNAETIIDFFRRFRLDVEVRNISLSLVCNYIERQLEINELQNWIVAVKGRESPDPQLGDFNLGRFDRPIHPIARTRLAGDPDSLGVITSPGDEEAGLLPEQLDRAHAMRESDELSANRAARMIRPSTEGLLLVYPISRYSGYGLPQGSSRRRLYENPEDPLAKNVVGLAISFPYSERAQRVRGEYVVGTVGWRPT